MRRAWFLAGLFLTTLSTLALEILATRLLSVITWYHLSFFAVSTALFGMSAGAVRVYLGGAFFRDDAARALARYASLLALSIPLCHAATLYVPLGVGFAARNLAAMAAATLALAVPFYLSGVVVAVALTRVPGPSGLVYAVDLAGAALGSLLVLPLLRFLDVSSAALVCAAVAAGGAACFRVFGREGHVVATLFAACLLLVSAFVNHLSPEGMRVVYAKGARVPRSEIAAEHWTIHGQIVAFASQPRPPYYWGAGRRTPRHEVELMDIKVDGGAGTAMTRWDGERASLVWVGHDVTSLPYHLRPGGEVAVIGVGGGRDLLTALWAGSRSVTGIEVNAALLRLLREDYREYAGLANRPEVSLVHDEARSFLTRTSQRFDVLQMSLIDTWAATGAGAFTLSENGLYTLEAWRTFLGVLEPGGVFSVSRWYSPHRASETSRMLALAVAALFDRGVANPRAHLALVSGGGQIATLLVFREPMTPEDQERLRVAVLRMGFDALLAPGQPPADARLDRIAASASPAELERAVADPLYDYSPPTDARPYFFNILRPRALVSGVVTHDAEGITAKGNLAATITLLFLFALSAILVGAVILLPLARSGLPQLAASDFAQALLYFCLIGAGFMLVQIPLMQRFSVYLGHPTYSVGVILFSMIAAAGAGSALSDRLPIERDLRLAAGIPLGIASILLVATLSLQPLIDATLSNGLLSRCALVVAFVSAASLPLGFCFPLGLRLVRRLSDAATPWMWGVNGACGVLAAVAAVGISIWSGIDTSLRIASAAYLLLALPSIHLWRRGARARA
jgi:SAM-dependent methyltransferase